MLALLSFFVVFGVVVRGIVAAPVGVSWLVAVGVDVQSCGRRRRRRRRLSFVVCGGPC